MQKFGRNTFNLRKITYFKYSLYKIENDESNGAYK